MQITLNKANKLLSKFKQARQDMRAVFKRSRFYHEDEKVEAITTINVSLANLTPRITEEIARMIDVYRRQFRDSLDITQDYFTLKEALFLANQQTGVSQRLSQIEFLTEKLNLYKDLINESKRLKKLCLRPEDVNYDLLAGNLAQQEGKGELNILVFDLNELEQERLNILNNMNRLEDEVAILNNQTTITVNLSEAGKSLAGIE